jgi:hypothetical protein
MTALSIASATAAQAQSARVQNAMNKRQAQNAISAANANYAQVNLEASQQAEAMQQKLSQNNLAASAAASTARTTAGERGVSGFSVDALMADIGADQNRYETSVRTNYDRAIGALDNQRENIYASAASTINGLKAPAMPDYLGAGLKIYRTYDDYKTRKATQ